MMETENNLQRRDYRIAERAMSVHMHAAEWALLDQVSDREQRSPEDMLTEIETGGDAECLTSSIRVFLLDYWRDQAAIAVSQCRGHPSRGSQSQESPCREIWS